MTERSAVTAPARPSELAAKAGWRRDLARARRLLADQGVLAFLRMSRHQLRRSLARLAGPGAANRRRPQRSGSLGMITPEEQAWLCDFASLDYSFVGAIVDLGCWLGSATIALARGLAQNPLASDGRGRIHSFDQFLWEEWMEGSVVGTPLAGRLREGDSFLPLFEAQIAPWRTAVVAHPGDLRTLGWPSGEPIELLFNDAAKSWELTCAIARNFYPALLPGRALLVEQDFCHYFTPWVHLIQERLRDFVEPVHSIPYSGSLVFRVVKPIPADLIGPDLGFSDFPAEEVERAFTRSLGLVAPPMRPDVWAARVMWEVHQGRREAALRLLREAPRRGLRGLDLEKVRALLRASPPSAA
jgi:hypothetical protein